MLWLGYALCIPLLIVLFFITCKILTVYNLKWDRSYKCLFGKTVLITGANSGIGYFTALDFAKRGARVILACRNKELGEKARKSISDSTGNSNVILKIVDLASFQSVRDFANDIYKYEKRLDILVNNAGAIFSEVFFTDDGLEETMQVNYFGPFLLTYLLCELLRKTGDSRVINVTDSLSRFHYGFKPNNLNAIPKYFPNYTLYIRSKLCLIFFSNELSKKMRKDGIKSNAVYPNVAYTNIHRSSSGFWRLILYIYMKCLKTPEEAAQSIINVAVSKQLRETSGKYFSNMKEIKAPKITEDYMISKKIWERTEELIALTEEEKSTFEKI